MSKMTTTQNTTTDNTQVRTSPEWNSDKLLNAKKGGEVTLNPIFLVHPRGERELRLGMFKEWKIRQRDLSNNGFTIEVYNRPEKTNAEKFSGIESIVMTTDYIDRLDNGIDLITAEEEADLILR